MYQRTITLQNGWLHLPIGRDVQRYYVRFSVDGQCFAELYLGLMAGTPDFYCGMELEQYKGKEVVLSVEDNVPPQLLDGILEGPGMTAENPLYSDLYQEIRRPRYHFSPKRGWMNDPNGLYYDGTHYHLYFQHNPYGILHGGVNMHWGHAVSSDGVHWKEYPDAIRPWGCKCHIASGSCLVDHEGVAGYGKGAVIAAFTHLGSRNFRVTPDEEMPSEGQFLAYSTDGGYHFNLFPNNPVIPTEDNKSWRDPRLFYHPDGGFGIAVYETTEKGNCVSFYQSKDLHHWERTARAEDLYECPDLFELTPVNDEAPRWVLYGADSMYRVGDFVNGAFHQVGERYPMDYGKCTYAGQTWTGRDDTDGRMHISWLRDESVSWTNPDSYPEMAFSQCMTVPCLLTLVKTQDGYRVNRNPIPAITSLRTGEEKKISLCSGGGKVDILPYITGDTGVTVTAQSPVTIRVGSNHFVYDPATGETLFDDSRSHRLQNAGPLKLRFLTDVMSCEFFLQEEVSASYGLEMKDRCVSIHCDGPFTVEGTSFEMKGIWE